MVGPVFVNVVNLVMEYVEEMSWAAVKFPVQFYRRLVYDTFVILDKQYLEPFLNALNSFNPAIQFTQEMGSNNFLSFLDSAVIRMPSWKLLYTEKHAKLDTFLTLTFTIQRNIDALLCSVWWTGRSPLLQTLNWNLNDRIFYLALSATVATLKVF